MCNAHVFARVSLEDFRSGALGKKRSFSICSILLIACGIGIGIPTGVARLKV